MSFPLPFSPANGKTTKITANATPTSVAGDLAVVAGPTRISVLNNGTVPVFVHLSPTTAPTATTGDFPMKAGERLTLDGNGITAAAVLSSTTTACDVYFSWGEGG